jgi:hypothetical protein
MLLEKNFFRKLSRLLVQNGEGFDEEKIFVLFIGCRRANH